MKPAEVRFYVDADILGLAKVLCMVRSDVTFPTFAGGKMFGRLRPPCPVTATNTDDTVWIPETARHGWLIITRDSAIQDRRSEINAVRDSGARMVVLVGKHAGSTWDQLDIVMRRWDRLEQLLAEPGPFIYSVSKSVWRRVPL
jgi:hypothetical protein